VLTFAIVASRTGRAVDPFVLKLLETRAGAEVPFPPERSTTWTNESGTVWFAGWQAAGRQGPGEPRWHAGADGLTAIAGRVWPRRDGWSGAAPVAVQLAEHLRAQPLAGCVDALAGVYVVASMSRQGTSTVAADPLGVGLLYWGHSPDLVVLSTRAAVSATILAADTGTAPRRDAVGVGWLAYAADMLGSPTGYQDISLVPDGAVVEIDSAGTVNIHRSPRPVWCLHADALAADPHAALDEVRAEMMAAIRTARRDRRTDASLGLTGGKDSRLLLALLLADGSASDLEYETYGDDDLPDVVIARQLAATFGLRHVTSPGVAERRAWRQRVAEAVRGGDGYERWTSREIDFRITAWATSGTRNVAQPHLGRLPSGGKVLLSGVFGEALRTNYPAATRLRSKARTSRFPVRLKHGSAGLVDREAAARYRSETHELLFEGAANEDSPQDIIDSFYSANGSAAGSAPPWRSTHRTGCSPCTRSPR
jgi:hypothetical protein